MTIDGAKRRTCLQRTTRQGPRAVVTGFVIDHRSMSTDQSSAGDCLTSRAHGLTSLTLQGSGDPAA